MKFNDAQLLEIKTRLILKYDHIAVIENFEVIEDLYSQDIYFNEIVFTLKGEKYFISFGTVSILLTKDLKHVLVIVLPTDDIEIEQLTLLNFPI